jgi:hypothetical protein
MQPSVLILHDMRIRVCNQSIFLSTCVTLGTVSAVRRGIRLFGFRFFPKIKLGSKLIDHRPNKLKGVSSEVLVCSLGNS